MEVQPLTLEELVNDATDINNFASNEAQSQAVSNQVNRTIGGANTVVKLIINKLALRQEAVTLQALNIVEVCVRNCGSRFHNEIGKYKFINELIKLLSSKYDGDITPESVKERVINLMYSWYTGLPHETKIGEAYKMLKQQGIIKRDPVDPNRPGNHTREKENTAFHDENNTQLLKTLLASKDADDLHSANKLIKNMVKEEEERLDRVSKRIQVLETVSNNVALLDEMIEKYDSNSNGSSLEIMNDLYERCLTLRPELFRLASKNVDDQDDSVGEILAASDELTRVIDLYKERVLFKKPDGSDLMKNERTNGGGGGGEDMSCLLDFDLNSSFSETASGGGAPTSDSTTIKNSLLDEQFKLLGLSTPSPEQIPVPTNLQTNTGMPGGYPGMHPMNMGALPFPQNGMMGAQQPQQPPMYSAAPVMLPNMNLYSNSAPVVPSQVNVVRPNVASATTASSSKPPPKKDLFDFDVFESDFLKKPVTNKGAASSISFPTASSKPVDDFSADQLLSLTPTDTSLPIALTTTQQMPVFNAAPLLPLSQEPVAVAAASPQPSSEADVASLLSSFPEQPLSLPDIAPVLPVAAVTPVATIAPIAAASPSVPTASASSAQPPQVTAAQQQNVSSMSPVNYMVPLEALKTGTHAPIPILDKDGLKTYVILAEDTRDDANPNVIVAILSTISMNTNPLSAYNVQVAVPKVMRVKLQPPNSTELAAFNPFVAPPSISQVMLIANPTKDVVKLRFKITYSIADMSYVETANIDQLPVR